MKRIQQVVAFTWLSAITVAVGLLEWRRAAASGTLSAPPAPASATFDRITVHRIDVVEPDGKPRLILSNAERYPGAIFNNKEYPHPGRDRGGVLFFNDDGSEAGGIGYSNSRSDKSAGAVLTMDQYGQDETMRLFYEEEDGKRAAGIQVFGDRQGSIEPLLVANTEMVNAKTDADRAAAKARFEKIAASQGQVATRMIIGRHDDDAELMLADKAGQARIVIRVDGQGEAHLDFLDAAGKITKSYGAPPSK